MRHNEKAIRISKVSEGKRSHLSMRNQVEELGFRVAPIETSSF
jgi:hypothetical protein